MSKSKNVEFIALSQFSVKAGMEKSVCEAFERRPGLVDTFPGFLRMQVLRPKDAPEEFWLLTWWRDESSYQAWHLSHDYHDSHKHIPKGLKLVPGSAKITFLESLPSTEIT